MPRRLFTNLLLEEAFIYKTYLGGCKTIIIICVISSIFISIIIVIKIELEKGSFNTNIFIATYGY